MALYRQPYNREIVDWKRVWRKRRDTGTVEQDFLHKLDPDNKAGAKPSHDDVSSRRFLHCLPVIVFRPTPLASPND